MSFDWGSVPRKPPSMVDHYLVEANECLEHGAYRMSVVASACAMNLGLDFVLREKTLVKGKRVLSLNEVIEKIKGQSYAPQGIMDNCEKVMHHRNAFAHPENILELQPSSRRDYHTLKHKFITEKEKNEAYIASQFDTKRLKTIAEESREITINTIKEALDCLLLPSIFRSST